MSDTKNLVQLIQEADLALVQMEQARSALDHAKLVMEMAKEDLDQSRAAYEAVIAKADEFDVPRAKLKKLAEERSAALLMSGLLSTAANFSKTPKSPKAPRKNKEPKLTPESELTPEIAFQDSALNELHS